MYDYGSINARIADATSQARVRWLARLTIPTLAALLAIAAGNTTAIAGPPATATCGAVLTQSVTLRSDLLCTGDGLIVGADGITIDLAGHRLIGTGTGTGIAAERHHDLNVRNGTITGFATDVNLSVQQDSAFTQLKITGTMAVFMELTTNIRFTDDVLRDTRARFVATQQTIFDRLHATNTNFSQHESVLTTFQHSALTSSPVSADETDRDIFTDDQLANSPISFAVTSRNWVIQNSVIRGAQVAISIGDGIPGAHILDNLFVGNEVGVEIGSFLPAADGTIISHNTFLSNGAAGLLVDSSLADAAAVTVSSNLFLRNGFRPNGLTDHSGRPVADGAHFATPSGSDIVVADNVTNHNADYGIFAEPGTVVDGRGNRSIHDPLGCLGVTCS